MSKTSFPVFRDAYPSYQGSEPSSRAEIKTEVRITWKYLDPIFQQEPTYLIWGSDLPPGTLPDHLRDVDGFVAVNGYHRFRDHLQRTGQDRGPGFVMVLSSEFETKQEVFGTMIHESAHLLQFQAEGFSLDHPEPVSRTNESWHGPLFIRSTLHLYKRAAALAPADIPVVEKVVEKEHTAGRHLVYSMAGLGTELASTPIDRPLTPILRSAPPAAFIDQWERDHGTGSFSYLAGPASGSASASGSVPAAPVAVAAVAAPVPRSSTPVEFPMDRHQARYFRLNW